MKEKIASFRIDGDKWQEFLKKAKSEGETASGLLKNFIDGYLDCTDKAVNTSVSTDKQEEYQPVSTEKDIVLTDLKERIDNTELVANSNQYKLRNFGKRLEDHHANLVELFERVTELEDSRKEREEVVAKGLSDGEKARILGKARNGLSDGELATIIGKTRQTVNKWRHGKRKAPQDLSWEVREGKWYRKANKVSRRSSLEL